MARLSSCKGCDKQITKEQKHIYSGKGYCKTCYDELHSNNEDRKTLLKLICEYYQIEVPTGIMMKQIKEYKDEFKYTYAGMTYTMWYIKMIENKPFDDAKYGIAYIKYYYEKAKAYFEQQQKITNSVNINNEEIKVVERKINVHKVYAKPNEHLLDLNTLIKEEE